MNTTRMTLIAACLVLLTPLGASADETHDRPPAAATAGDAEMTDGEVRKIDLAAGKLTLKHAEIKNLDMPAMTMVFRARNPSLLDGLKAGDRVDFDADKIDGQYVVTAIRKAR